MNNPENQETHANNEKQATRENPEKSLVSTPARGFKYNVLSVLYVQKLPFTIICTENAKMVYHLFTILCTENGKPPFSRKL